MESNYHSLVKEFSKTKKELGEAETSIRRLTGRNPEDVANGSKRERERRERERRESSTGKGYSSTYRKRPMIAYSGYDRKRPRGRESDDYISEDDDSPKPTLQSTVVAKYNQVKSRKATIDEMNSNAKFKARNRRMFGSLLVGTLQKFENEEKKRKEKEAMRTEIEQKIDDANTRERERIRLEKETLFNTRRDKKIKLRILEKKIERAESYDVFETNYKNMGNFIMTKTHPAVFFLPRTHTPATKKCLEETKTKLNELINKKRTSYHVQLKDIDESYKKNSVSSFKGKEGNGAKEVVESQVVAEAESKSLVVEQEELNPEEEESTNYRSMGSSLIDQEFEPIYD